MPSKAEIRARIQQKMERAKAARPGSTYRIYENQDGTIDAELTMPLARGQSFRGAITGDVEQTFRTGRIPYTWTSTGMRFPEGEEEKSPFDTYKGMPQVFTAYYYDAPGSNKTALVIEETTKRRKIRKPVQAVLRLHWNPKGIKPPRESR